MTDSTPQPCLDCKTAKVTLYKLLDSLDALDEQTDSDRTSIWALIRRLDTRQLTVYD